MRTNKIKKLFVLGLAAGALLLSGCDKVETPYPNDGPIVNFNGQNSEIYNNTMKQIYETLVTSGDSNSLKVLVNVLYIYSQSVFGPFFGEDGLKATVESGSEAKLDEYAKKYTTFQVLDDNGNIDNEHTRTRVKTFYNDVLYRIHNIFYGYLSNTSYIDRNEFVEEKFYKAQIKNYYDLPETITVNGTEVTAYMGDHVLVDGADNLTGDAEKDAAILGKYFRDIFGVYENYIEINVLPDIYRQELTAQYLIDENYSSTLRNMAAREVHYITLEGDSNNKVSALLNAYDTNVINGSQEIADAYDFTFLDRLYKGVDQALYDENTEVGKLAKTIYDSANWTLKTIDLNGDGTDDYSYYEESKFGDICEKYNVLLDANNRYDQNFETEWNNFTSSGTYSKETGFEIQRRELVTKDNTVSGWFTPGGLGSLPDSLKNRVFRTQVANQMTSSASDSSEYLKNLQGHYYLIPKDPLSSDPHPYIVKDGSNYTIVEVKTAVKSSRLNPNDEDDYYGVDRAYEVVRKVAYSLASSDTWEKAARSYYVEKMGIIYRDEYVLDYFKTTFPDLFD